MSFSRPFQWYHSRADLIWPDGTFKKLIKILCVITLNYFLAELEKQSRSHFHLCSLHFALCIS